MNLIVALDQDNAIAKEGKLLCHLPQDLAFFKSMTLDKYIIMGRKTIDSLPGGRLLPQRTTIILTRNTKYQKEGAIICHSEAEVLAYLASHKINHNKVFVCGGAKVYALFRKYCELAYVTKIEHSFEGDEFIEGFDQPIKWEKRTESRLFTENSYDFKFLSYRRR